MTLKENKIDILRRARKRITSDQNTCICFALDDIVNIYPKLSKARDHLQKYIMNELRGSIFLTHWVRVYRPQLQRNSVTLKEYRIQWIDWMINCLEEDIQKQKKKRNQ